MTTKDTAGRTGEAIDFTMMYATHDAFRRDLGRLSAAAAGTADAPGVRAGWENFKAQLLLHHSVEDTHLWPRAAVYVPWVLDGAGPGGQQRFLAALPPPVRVISRFVWQPRYRKRGLWQA